MESPEAKLVVAVVDDEAGVRALVESILEDAGIEVHPFSRASEALQAFSELDFDVIVSDYSMPDMDGISMTEELLRRDPTCQVLLVSAFLDRQEDAKKGIAAGIVGYVDKPFSPQDLLVNVQAAGRSRRRWRKQKQALEEANQRIQVQHQNLVQSEKMASIGQLAAGVAHEINNPVGFVSSNLGSLQEYVAVLRQVLALYEELDMAFDNRDAQSLRRLRTEIKALHEKEDLTFILEDIDQLLAESKDGTERIRDIVLNLKSFARVDDAELKEADINAGIEATLKIVWNDLKYKATVEKDLNTLPRVRCYLGQLNQVFMNLLVNAGHAIEKEGTIRIHTHAEGEEVIIQISDTGCGIPPENVAKLFDPFFTTKEVGKGTGLGLAIAHGIIETHQGTLNVESQVGVGTTFTITLPVAGAKSDG